MVTLNIDPVDALIDVPRSISVQGLAPGETVSLVSHTVRGPGVPWQAQAHFVADAQGCVAVDRTAPLAGSSYCGISPMGLIWAQTPLRETVSREVFADDMVAPLETHFAVMRQGHEVAHAHMIQRLYADGVQRHEVRANGLAGTLFTPATPGPHPAVMILNGSGGGINEPRAALYASHGYAAFALGYFKAPGRPDYISDTHLEYFETGLDWLKQHVRPLNGFIALSGQSRGGELVLLLASLMPERISAVIGYVPGAVVHCAQNACNPATGRDGPAWWWRGKPLPHLWENNRTATWEPWDHGPEPRRHTNAILTGLQDREAVERARIRVENIQAPILLLSGSDDGSWPSSLYGRMVRQSLKDHPWPVEHLDYEGAGHAILFPYVPTTQLIYRHPVSGRLSTTGGTPAVNAHANADSWHHVLSFLERAVAAHASQSY